MMNTDGYMVGYLYGFTCAEVNRWRYKLLRLELEIMGLKTLTPKRDTFFRDMMIILLIISIIFCAMLTYILFLQKQLQDCNCLSN